MTYAVIDVPASRRPLTWLDIFCGAYTIVAFGLAPALYIANLRAFTLQFLPAALFLSFLGLLVAAILKRPKAPLAELNGIIRSRGAGALAISLVMCIGMAAF